MRAQAPPPVLTDTVNDFAHIIDPASRAELDKRIRALKAATGDIVVVATVPTFQPYGTIDEYAVKMFENGGRGIGDKGKDNGLLIVVAKNDRKVRIEVGYDLEAFIPDGFAGETIRDAIGPAFRAERYGPGLLDATTRIITRIAEKRNVTLPDVPVTRAAQASRSRGRLPIGLIFWAIAIVVIIARASRPGRRRYWGVGPWSNWTGGVGGFGGGGFGGGSGGSFGGGGGGFGGGGFGGFSGGSSGGGGSSGSW
ncbi:MAG TPA: TPM domain-containing protein [Vicinamibacterales bacterium]